MTIRHLQTTLRHLYRNMLLTTILSRLGLCASYDFGQELETALAKAIEEVSTKLTPQEITPAADVDNMIPKRCLPLYKRNNTRSLKLEESHTLSPACTYIIAVVLILLKMIPLFHPQKMMRCSLNV